MQQSKTNVIHGKILQFTIIEQKIKSINSIFN